MRQKGYVIFTKNGKEYKVSDKRFLNSGKKGFYRIEERCGCFSNSIVKWIYISSKDIESIRFFNCNFAVPFDISFVFMTHDGNLSSVSVENVTFGNQYVEIRGYVPLFQCSNLHFHGKTTFDICTNAEYEEVFNILKPANLSTYATELNVKNYTSLTDDMHLELKADNINLENVNISTNDHIKICCKKLGYKDIVLRAPFISISGLFSSSKMPLEYHEIDDEKLKKLEAINRLYSCLQGLENDVNKQVTTKVNRISEISSKKIEQLEKQIEELKRAKRLVMIDAKHSYERQSIGSYVKKNTK